MISIASKYIHNKDAYYNYNNNLRWILIFYFLLCSIITGLWGQAGVFLALLGGSLLINKFGIYEYLSIGVILLVKSQNPDVLSSEDIASHVNAFELISMNLINFDGLKFGDYESGEIILPVVFWIFTMFYKRGSPEVFSFMFILTFLIIFYFFLKGLKLPPIVSLSTLLLIDVNLVAHLFRQSLASVILLVALLPLVSDKKIKFKNYIILFLSFFIHLTNLVFAPIAFIFKKISLNILKILVIIFLLSAFWGFGKEFLTEMIGLAYGIPVLGKVAFSLEVIDQEGGVRALALISIFSALLIKKDILILRIFLGFSVLMLITYHIPILGSRVGLIATSILTGIPVGYLLRDIGYKIKTKLRVFQ